MVNLKEYIYNEMDILFLALNAPETSNANAHWFSRNLSFWNLLFKSGLITQQINDSLKGDEIVFGSTDINYNNWIYGVTDLNHELIETNSQNVSIETKHLDRILKILESNHVKKLCLMHSKVGECIRNSGKLTDLQNNRYGYIGKIGETLVYEVPFHNASISNKEQYYQLLIDATKPIQENNSKLETNKVALKIKPGKHFIIPSNGNSITQNDIKKNTLRITVDFKDYFPANDSIVKIQIGNQIFHAKYTRREGRSSLLKLDKAMISLLNLKANQQVKFELIGTNSFRVSKF
ncbi:hypothetical protein [Sphingobacterium lactis]|uniref:hypothetical protein n=1 Tax=Sphingobacterium lactis TaxID=797291 RepID=UPI003DA30956